MKDGLRHRRRFSSTCFSSPPPPGAPAGIGAKDKTIAGEPSAAAVFSLPPARANPSVCSPSSRGPPIAVRICHRAPFVCPPSDLGIGSQSDLPFRLPPNEKAALVFFPSPRSRVSFLEKEAVVRLRWLTGSLSRAGLQRGGHRRFWRRASVEAVAFVAQ